jgi:hypothetical protein
MFYKISTWVYEQPFTIGCTIVSAARNTAPTRTVCVSHSAARTDLSITSTENTATAGNITTSSTNDSGHVSSSETFYTTR